GQPETVPPVLAVDGDGLLPGELADVVGVNVTVSVDITQAAETPEEPQGNPPLGGPARIGRVVAVAVPSLVFEDCRHRFVEGGHERSHLPLKIITRSCTTSAMRDPIPPTAAARSQRRW